MVSAAWPVKAGNVNAAASKIARNIVLTTCLLCCVSTKHSGQLGAGAGARGLIYVKLSCFKNRGFRVDSRFTNHDSRLCLEVEHHPAVHVLGGVRMLRTCRAETPGNTGSAGTCAPRPAHS